MNGDGLVDLAVGSLGAAVLLWLVNPFIHCITCVVVILSCCRSPTFVMLSCLAFTNFVLRFVIIKSFCPS